MTLNRDIEKALATLADRGWGPRRIVPREEFVLTAASLPTARTAEEMAEVVQQLYHHARKWAPGFEIPFSVPKVIVTPFLDSAGRYGADADGYLSIRVAPEFAGRRTALLAILAHEACHHILDLSGLRGSLTQDVERLTDLAMFVCGFGALVLEGHSLARKVGSSWTSVHLGYLSSDEYQTAQNWVLAVQRIHQADPARSSDNLTGRFLAWLKRQIGAEAAARTIAVDVSIPVPDPISRRRNALLARLHGDQALMGRLMQHERLKRPVADEIDLLDAVAESLERDRR